jgi:hypothetical protein
MARRRKQSALSNDVANGVAESVPWQISCDALQKIRPTACAGFEKCPAKIVKEGFAGMGANGPHGRAEDLSRMFAIVAAGTIPRDPHSSMRRSYSHHIHVARFNLRSALRLGGRFHRPSGAGVTTMIQGGHLMNVTRVLGLAAVGALLILAAPAERAQALSLASPGGAAAVQDDSRQMTTEVHWRHHHHHWHHRHHHRHWGHHRHHHHHRHW